MAKSYVVAGLAGCFTLASLMAAAAQQAASTDCGKILGCPFYAKGAAPQPSAPRSAQPAATAGATTRAQAAPMTDMGDDSAIYDRGDKNGDKSKAKPKAHSSHPITIAAGPTEIGRLKALAAALPKSNVKIVDADARASKSADFAVTTSLDRSEAGEKAKLFTEQLHVIAGSGVHSLADLKDKVVSFGPDKGAAQAAARKAFEALNIKVQETPLEIDNALDGLTTGDIDAVVLLAPQPIERLKTVTAPGLHLVAWPENGALPDGATATSIDAGAYPNLAGGESKVPALGVDAVLDISVKGAKDRAAKAFLTSLAQQSSRLSKRGFDLLKADLENRNGRRVASAGR